MKCLIVSLSMMFVLMGVTVAFADCDSDRWTNPRNPGSILPLGDNTYASLSDAVVNLNGNIQIPEVVLLNEKGGACQREVLWEICCERQETRVLQLRERYDSDWPSDKDIYAEGDHVWKSYSSNSAGAKVANQLCGKKNQLPKVSQ
jgi:hypothetical protein